MSKRQSNLFSITDSGVNIVTGTQPVDKPMNRDDKAILKYLSEIHSDDFFSAATRYNIADDTRISLSRVNAVINRLKRAGLVVELKADLVS